MSIKRTVQPPAASERPDALVSNVSPQVEETKHSEDVQVVLRWRLSPKLFVLEAIGVRPTNQQMEALDLVGEMSKAKIAANTGKKLTAKQKELADKIGISIRSGHGTGKDAFLAWVYLWLIFCFPDPKGMVTGPTKHQLDAVLWSEISKWLKKSKIELWRHIGIQSDKLYLNGRKDDWFITKRTANVTGGEDEQAETLAGMHDEFMIFAVDEASGVPKGVFRPLEGAQTGLMNFAILVGNMTRSSGYFFDTHFTQTRKYWVVLQWDCEKSNMDEVTGNLGMSSYVQRIAEKYGKDSNFYRIRVKGEPPVAESDALIPYEWVENAKCREVVPEEYDPVLIGVDAGAGVDKSAVLIRKGLFVYPIKEYHTRDTMELVGWVCRDSVDFEADAIMVDVIGIGNGVYNRLIELRYPAYPVNVAESSSRKDQFVRLRDELFWNLREIFEKGLIQIPDDDELIGELASIKYKVESSGKIKIESKADMKKRGLHSPNKADSLMLSFYMPDYVFAKKRPKDPYEEDIDGFRPSSWMSA